MREIVEWAFAVIFACITALGINWVTASPTNQPTWASLGTLWRALLSALGAFLFSYIAFAEKPHTGWKSTLSAIIAFGLLIGLRWPEENNEDAD